MPLPCGECHGQAGGLRQAHLQAGEVHVLDDAAVAGQDHLLQQEAAQLQGGQADFAICGREDRGVRVAAYGIAATGGGQGKGTAAACPSSCPRSRGAGCFTHPGGPPSQALQSTAEGRPPPTWLSSVVHYPDELLGQDVVVGAFLLRVLCRKLNSGQSGRPDSWKGRGGGEGVIAAQQLFAKSHF